MSSNEADLVWLALDSPPEVINSGRGTHGVHRLTDDFQLPQLWSLHLYDYHADLGVAGRSYPIAPGTVSLVPPATPHHFRYRGPSSHLYAHFRAPGGLIDAIGPGPAPAAQLRVVMSPAGELPEITDLMASAIAAAAVRPERTRADIWGVLLRLAYHPTPAANRIAADHVRAAMSYIESRLQEPLAVTQVAASVGVSANHLTRMFGAETGQTVVGYIRRRRIDRARRLLISTTMPIPAIAASVGFADLQAFNKACRAVTGMPPRRLRETH